MVQNIADLVRRGLTLDRSAAFDPAAPAMAFAGLAGEALVLIGPLLLVLVVAALAGPLMLGGLNLSSKALTPDWTRLDPIKGFGRMFSINSISELVKAIFKSLLISGVVIWVVLNEKDQLFALIGQPIEAGLHSVGRTILFSALLIVASMFLIVAADVPFQLWQYQKKLRMSKEEVRREMKELEGDPQLKARIRSQQREVAPVSYTHLTLPTKRIV